MGYLIGVKNGGRPWGTKKAESGWASGECLLPCWQSARRPGAFIALSNQGEGSLISAVYAGAAVASN
jgi:hypothetical protein